MKTSITIAAYVWLIVIVWGLLSAGSNLWRWMGVTDVRLDALEAKP